MNSDEYAAAWLSEMWRPVREIPREEREAERVKRESQPVENGVEIVHRAAS